MGILVVMYPYLVSGVQKLVCEQLGIHAKKRDAVRAYIIEANVYWGTLEASVFLLVVGVSVKVVVQRIVVYHLRYAQIVKFAWVVGVMQVLGKYLH